MALLIDFTSRPRGSRSHVVAPRGRGAEIGRSGRSRLPNSRAGCYATRTKPLVEPACDRVDRATGMRYLISAGVLPLTASIASPGAAHEPTSNGSDRPAGVALAPSGHGTPIH